MRKDDKNVVKIKIYKLILYIYNVLRLRCPRAPGEAQNSECRELQLKLNAADGPPDHVMPWLRRCHSLNHSPSTKVIQEGNAEPPIRGNRTKIILESLSCWHKCMVNSKYAKQLWIRFVVAVFPGV